ncbi:complement component C8 gamma chain [Podarcis lilfordi]|uniref:Complement component C8 gamma chain n=1 Tax=Podarcis lilfordi TaxID=74358 RepID=A0AA35LDV5_9SAUR|nr:complement component C8 gamma chain [Podarcis lilfordi]
MEKFLLFAFSALVLGSSFGRMEAVEVERLYGKWYEVALGSTCRWVQANRGRFTAGTLVLGAGKAPGELTATSTRLRQGACRTYTQDYQKGSKEGRFAFQNAKFAILVTEKNSTHGLSTSAKLYGRSPALREDLVEDFRRRALALGIPEEAIFVLSNQGECVPPKAEDAPQERVRRTPLFEEEGSADGFAPAFPDVKEADCQLPRDAGPCLGAELRYFYNASAQSCQSFLYGGCLDAPTASCPSGPVCRRAGPKPPAACPSAPALPVRRPSGLLTPRAAPASPSGAAGPTPTSSTWRRSARSTAGSWPKATTTSCL